MSATIEMTISEDAKALLNRLEDRPGTLNAIRKELDNQLNLTHAHIRSVRFRGNNNKPFPVEEHKLGIREAHYFRSLRTTKAEITGDTVTGAIGSNVKYAGIHEFGGTIKRVQVAGSVRLATDRRGNLLRQGKNGKLAVFAKAKRKTAVTVPFSGGKRYEITIPARAPITHGIQDRATETGNAVSQAIIRFWSAKGGAA